MCLKMRRNQQLVQLNDAALQKLRTDEDSCVEVQQCKHHITLHPFHLGNIAESTKEILNSGISKYHKEFDGILMGYQNVVVLGYVAPMSDDTCYMHTNVQADFYIFKPTVGKTLNGTINKKSQDHIGCLVHKLFNVSIPKPYDDDDWLGFKADIGQEIQIKITFTSLDARLPYIKGELIAILSEDSGISTSEETTTPKKKANKGTKFIIDVDEEQESDVEDAIEKKKSEKKKKKKKLLEQNSQTYLDNLDGNESVTRKKKSKKDKKPVAVNGEQEIEELLTELKETPKNKRKRDILDETLPDLNLDEILADVGSLKKENVPSWNNVDIVLPPDSDMEDVLKNVAPPKTKKRKRSIKEEESEISQTPKRPKKSKRKST